jgi:hypothetical protein
MHERMRHLFARPAAVAGSPLGLPEPDTVLRVALLALLGVMLVSGFSWRILGVDLLAFLGRLPGCAFRAWTGFPCPGCGMGHAFVQLSRLQLAAAVGANPAAPLLAVAMWVGAFRQAPDRAVSGMNPRLAASCLALVLVAWLWRILSLAGVSATVF